MLLNAFPLRLTGNQRQAIIKEALIYSYTVVPAQAGTQYNAALHEPVPCMLELYHMQAGLIMGTTLDALDEALADHLSTGAS